MSEKDKEKKKVVLKVSFSKREGLPNKKEQPQLITEWNYTRIAIALIILFILIATGVGLLLDDNKRVHPANIPQSKQTKDAQTTIRNVPDKAADSIVLKETKPLVDSSLSNKKQAVINTFTETLDNVVRAQLAKGIWKNEPFGKITDSIKVNSEEATGIFYFTELNNMKGQTVFHVWKHEGTIIFKKQRDVLEDSYKTYTSKLFTKRSVGSWSVETVDSNNKQMNVINFTVVEAVD